MTTSPRQHQTDTDMVVDDPDFVRRLLALCVDGVDSHALDVALRSEGRDVAAVATVDACSMQGRIQLEDDIAAANISASLPEDERLRLHRLLAESIHVASIDVLESARDEATHLAAAGELERAIARVVDAAGTARTMGDGNRALELLDLAVGFADQLGRRRLELRERRARLATELDAPTARGAWLELVQLHDERRRTDDAARARYFLFWASGDEADARSTLDQAAADAGTGPWATRAAALGAILDEQYDAAIAHDRTSLQLARSNGDRRLEALALLGLAASLSMVGQMQRGVELQRQAIAIADEIDDYRASVLGQLNLVSMFLDDMRPARALEHADSLLSWIARTGMRGWRAEALAQRSTALAQLGRIDEALATADGARADLEVAPAYSRSLAHLQHAVTLALAGGARDRIEHLLEQATIDVDGTGSAYVTSEATELRAMLAAADLDLDTAFDLATSIELTDDLKRRRVALLLARIGAQHDRDDFLERAAEVAGANAARDLGVDPTLREVSATCAAALDPASSIDPLREAIDDWTRCGHACNASRARLSLGAILTRRGDRDAQATLDQARRELLEMGCRIDVDCDADGAASPDTESSPLLLGLGRRERADVLASFGTKRFADGDVLAGPDHERDAAAYVIRSGQVRLVARSADGRRMTIDLLDAGDVVGESLALGHGVDSLHAEAIGEVVVGVLTAAVLHRLVDRHPVLGRNLLELVGSRARRSAALAEELAFRTVEQRFARRILELSERFGHPTLDGARMVRYSFTQAELAELVHARRETINGLMKELREAGVIELRKRRIVIVDQVRLQALAAS